MYHAILLQGLPVTNGYGRFSHPLLSGHDTICRVGFALSDDRAAIGAFVKAISPSFAAARGSSCLFDFSGCEYFGPFAAAILFANWLQSIVDGQYQDFRFPGSRPKVQAFLQFSGLLHHFYHGPLPDAHHPGNVTVPVQTVRSVTFDVGRPIIDLVRRFTHLSEEAELYFNNCVNEVMQNVEDHACSSIGAVYCARYLETPRKVRIAMVDRGLGIATTLRRAYSDITGSEDALRRVIAGGHSAKSRRNNFGLGIRNLWDQVVRSLGGEVFLVSEDAVAYSRRDGTARTEPLGARFPGTGVFLTIPVGV